MQECKMQEFPLKRNDFEGGNNSEQNARNLTGARILSITQEFPLKRMNFEERKNIAQNARISAAQEFRAKRRDFRRKRKKFRGNAGRKKSNGYTRSPVSQIGPFSRSNEQTCRRKKVDHLLFLTWNKNLKISEQNV